MIDDADSVNDEAESDGKVSFKEFKVIFSLVDEGKNNLKTANLWRVVKKEVALKKGAKAVLQRLAESDQKALQSQRNEKKGGNEVTAVNVVIDGSTTATNDDGCISNSKNATYSDFNLDRILNKDTDRVSAIRNAGISGSILFAVSCFRKFFLKI